MAKKAPLADKQLAVLQWVADGRPKGVYDDGFEHRITARALERRGLIDVRGHGPSWRVSVTAIGHYYLEHGTYPPSDEPEPPGPAGMRGKAAPPTHTPIDNLFEQLDAVSGVLRLDAPSEVDRISYRRAVENARVSGEVPHRHRLKISGTKHGPLLIELLTIAEPETADTQIGVPPQADHRRPEIRALQESRSLLAVSEDTRARAIALVQAMSDECRRRGWSLTIHDRPSFLITIGEDEYRCVLSEEREKRDVFTDADLATRKYDWQRVSPTRQEVWSGRLRLEVGPHYGGRWWADRRRWTLASKLPEVFAALHDLSTAARNRRDALAAHHREQIREWEAAVPRARKRYLGALNADRARTQAAAWAQAEQLRAYANAVLQRAATLDDTVAAAAEAWASWLNDEAARGDPLFGDSAKLALETPDDLSAAELDKYMPHRWTVRRTPDPPTYLPT